MSILRLIESGKRLIAEIERLKGVSPLDAARRAKRVMSAERAVLIREATSQGLSIDWITRQFDVSKSTVERARRQK